MTSVNVENGVLVGTVRSPFGAVGDGTTDDSAAIQAAIDSGEVVLPAGTYRAAGLMLRSGLRWRGAGIGRTIIQSPAGSSSAVFTMPTGAVQHISMADFEVRGTGNAGQHAFHIQAQPGGGGAGGLWRGTFERLTIRDFDGAGFWFQGGATGTSLVNQFIDMRRVDVFRGSSETARGLKATGQNGQFTFTNCRFDGTDITQAGYNIELSRQFTNAVADGDNAPYAFSFLGCTAQNSQRALYVDRALLVKWRDGYFENLRYAVLFENGAYGGEVTGSRFANAASDGASGGWGVKVGSNAKVEVEGNWFEGAIDQTYVGTQSSGGELVVGLTSYAADDAVYTDSGMTAQRTATSTLTASTHRTLIVNGTTPITVIRSHLTTGGTIVVKAHNSDLTFQSGGNLTLPTSPYTLTNGKYATFTKFDLGANWTLTAVSP